jgi:hypothetical protein
VAVAVAQQAVREGLAARVAMDDLVTAVKSMMWEPIYCTYRLRQPMQHR